MRYSLFLDDVREISDIYPNYNPNEWVLCRGIYEAFGRISIGWPVFISFDHDLGEGGTTGMDLAKYIVRRDMDHGEMPDDFGFAVHSANPVGADNIRSYLNSYLRSKGNGFT